jgi:prohibitin 1
MRAVVALLVVVLVSGCSVVGPGERGVRVSLGSASDDVKEPGAYFWLPFLLGMAKLDVQVQKSEVESSAASKDMQEITTHVAVNWSISPEKVVQLYKTVGDEDDILDRIISPAVNEVMKASTAKRTAEEALTRRMEMKADIDTVLKTRLATYGVNLSDVNIVNFTFSKEFMDAIEKKQIAEQEAKQAEYVALQAIQQAKAEVNRAKGQAEAQQLLRTTLTPAILQQRAIEKWDGSFPQVMGNGALPFISLKLRETASAE